LELQEVPTRFGGALEGGPTLFSGQPVEPLLQGGRLDGKQAEDRMAAVRTPGLAPHHSGVIPPYVAECAIGPQHKGGVFFK
jgi:hypothetical protein